MKQEEDRRTRMKTKKKRKRQKMRREWKSFHVGVAITFQNFEENAKKPCADIQIFNFYFSNFLNFYLILNFFWFDFWKFQCPHMVKIFLATSIKNHKDHHHHGNIKMSKLLLAKSFSFFLIFFKGFTFWQRYRAILWRTHSQETKSRHWTEAGK
jgi:hypothetical protein